MPHDMKHDIPLLMQSSDYKKRFIAEYWYTKRNFDGLNRILEKWDAGQLDFKPDCPRSIYDLQSRAMYDYLAVLEARAKIEGIEL